MSQGQTLIGCQAPRNADNKIDALKTAGLQAFAVVAIAHLPRPGDGRAIVARQRRRLQSGVARRERVDAILSNADDRGPHP